MLPAKCQPFCTGLSVLIWKNYSKWFCLGAICWIFDALIKAVTATTWITEPEGIQYWRLVNYFGWYGITGWNNPDIDRLPQWLLFGRIQDSVPPAIKLPAKQEKNWLLWTPPKTKQPEYWALTKIGNYIICCILIFTVLWTTVHFKDVINEQINSAVKWCSIIYQYWFRSVLTRWLLTHSGLVTPYGDRDLRQHWLR